MRNAAILITLLFVSYAHGFNYFTSQKRNLTWNDVLTRHSIRWSVSIDAPAICRESMRVAAQKWTLASQGVVRFEEVAPSSAFNPATTDLWINWSTDGQKMDHSYLAYATFSAQGANISSGKIVINAGIYDFNRDPFFDGCAGKKANLDSVMLHELGHILGMDHSDSNLSTVRGEFDHRNLPTMWSEVFSGASTLHTDDIEGILALYPAGPSTEFKIMISQPDADFLRVRHSMDFKANVNESVHWDFGDGSSSESSTGVKHMYRKAGRYMVKATTATSVTMREIEVGFRKPRVSARLRSKLFLLRAP